MTLTANVAIFFAQPCTASEPGYEVWFAGHVLSVDVQRGRLRIARGPTETAGPGIEECTVANANLKLLRPGMDIEAQADTRRRPWRVLHLRIMEHKYVRPRRQATMADLRDREKDSRRHGLAPG